MSVDFSEAASRQLERPIAEALSVFTALTEGDVTFGAEATVLHQLRTDERPVSHPAAVRYLGATVGSLTAMVFKPYDGTGDRHAPGLHSSGGYFLENAKIVPRLDEAAQALHGDIHLAIAAFRGEAGTAEQFNPRLFAGSLSLFGPGPEPAETGYLGQNNLDFHDVMSGSRAPAPVATRTVQPERLYPSFTAAFGDHWDNDLRAMYNRYPGISQVAGIITLNRGDRGQVTEAQADMLHRLWAVPPAQGQAEVTA